MSAPRRSAPSLAIKLFGTEEVVIPPRILKAGPLTAELDSGNLRHIRFGGVEVIRAISFIVRDRNWGTYNPTILDLEVREGEGFTVSYRAVAADGVQSFHYSAKIRGDADGRVDFEAEGVAKTDFQTNRTGFVVLHPIVGVSGRPVSIEHVDGSLVEGAFPDLIDPVQPMMDLRALTHEPVPGLRLTCRMEGDAFEMEDQRNWTDASFKTYVRPLARAWPYVLPAGERLEQAIRLRVVGPPPSLDDADGSVVLTLGGTLGRAPRFGLGLDPDEIGPTRANAAALQALGPDVLVCHYDPRRDHGRETLKALADTAAMIGAEPWLEAVVVDVEGFAEEVKSLGRDVDAIGSPFPTVLLSPAPDLKCTLPGSVWPSAPPADALFRVARGAFPTVRIGGGMFSYFTEFNRKRPPVDLVDLVTFTTIATMHAGDDHSVMEGLEALPAIARSARAIAGDKPFVVGPSAIGMRHNPYGDAPMPNPGNVRQAMTYNDPRHRGLLGAAWTLGCFARLAAGGAEVVTFGATTGAFGVVHTARDWPQPWFDDEGGLFPVFPVLRGLAGLAGRPMVSVEPSRPDAVQAIAVERDGGVEVWAANLTGAPIVMRLDRPVRDAAVLDDDAFVSATTDPDVMAHLARPMVDGRLTLCPYAIARIRLA